MDEIKAKKIEIPQSIIDIWQKIVDAISVILQVPSVMINKLDSPNLEVFRSNNSPQNPFPTGTTIPMLGLYCENAAKQRKNLKVEDARRDPVWANSPTAKAGIYSYLGFPLLWPDGEVFGTLCAVDTKENKWIDPSTHLLESVKRAIEAHLELVLAMEELKQKNELLNQTLAEVKTLRGLIPICISCKKIRDDRGYWNQLEDYIQKHSSAKFSHGLCPDCARKLYPNLHNHKS